MNRTALLAPALLSVGTAAHAGAPYVTDDPEPPETGKWEVISFAEGARLRDGTEGAMGLDINYGLAEDLQVTTAVQAEFAQGEETDFGLFGLAASPATRLVAQ